jgi:hypothetical protein
MTIKIELKGLKEVQKFLENASIDILQKSEQGIKQAGLFIQGEVVESVAGHRAEPRSVDTGRFLNSIRATFPQPLVAVIETNVEYAKFLEFGTSKFMPRPHFRNTIVREQSKVVDYLKEKIAII